MDYETQDRQQPYTAPPAEKPDPSLRKRKKRVLLFVGIAAFLILAAGSAVYFLSGVSVHFEKTDDSFSLVVGKDTREEAAPQQPDAVDPTAHLGSGQKLTVAPSAQSVPNIPSAAPGALSLQEIYTRSQACLASLAAARQRGTVFSTAVILSKDGYLLTNAKNVERAASLFVTLDSGEMLEASLVGLDAASDLAVLKVEAKDLTPAVFGDSDLLRVGDLAVSIRSPLSPNASATMTTGIISAVNPPLSLYGRQMSLLRTSAVTGEKIGGPIFNCYGQIVGLSTVRLERAYASSYGESTGLVIPTSAIKSVVDELLEKGYVAGKPTIGVSVEELPDRARIYYGLPNGVYVTSVQADSGAEQAGVQVGDIITALDDQPVVGAASLEQLRNSYAPGDTVELTVYREGHYFSVPVTLI